MNRILRASLVVSSFLVLALGGVPATQALTIGFNDLPGPDGALVEVDGQSEGFRFNRFGPLRQRLFVGNPAPSVSCEEEFTFDCDMHVASVDSSLFTFQSMEIRVEGLDVEIIIVGFRDGRTVTSTGLVIIPEGVGFMTVENPAHYRDVPLDEIVASFHGLTPGPILYADNIVVSLADGEVPTPSTAPLAALGLLGLAGLRICRRTRACALRKR